MGQKALQPYSSKLIKHPYRFVSGVLFTLIGWFAIVYDPSLILFGDIQVGGVVGFIAALMAVPLWLIGTPLMLTSMELKKHYVTVERLSNILLMFPFLILLFFVSAKFIAVGIYGFILGMGLWLSKKSTARKSPQLVHHMQQTHAAQHGSNAQPELSVYRDATNLTLLLSRKGNMLLDDLVKAINNLNGQLSYLENNHAYLAVSVSELINDLTQHTIVRLDNLAKEFVHNGLVNAEEKQLFSQQHETQVIQLMNEHLEEVSALNQRILDKKMASFNDLGSSLESVFRNSVMELKILLRWLIAKSPENQVSSHEVLLKRLEETTLKHMHDAFYKAETTQSQKVALQQQIEELIAHFKEQAPHIEQVFQSKTTDTPMLLEYSENQALDFSQCTETQAFIEFNAQYVKQLKQHWH